MRLKQHNQSSARVQRLTQGGRGVKPLALALVAGMAATAFSAEWRIPAGDLDALTNAFANLASGDVVTLAKGTYDFSLHPDAFMSVNGSGAHPAVITNRLQLSRQNVTLRGESGATREEVVVDGGGEGYRLFYINSVSQAGLVVSNLTLRNFGAGYQVEGLGDTLAYRGAVINATSQACRIADCVIRDCLSGRAALYGDGISCIGTLLTNCVGSASSGAAEFGTYVDCRFIGNRGENGGAASGIRATNCWFEANAAANRGGATSSATVVDSTFVANRAKFFGGAVSGGQFVGCTFSSNVTETAGSSYGGGVGYGVESISNCLFVANGPDLPSVSGSILLDCGVVRDSVFRDNICTNRGWGLVVASERAALGLELYDCVFTNSPCNRGGMLVDNRRTAARGRLVRCRFYDNLRANYDNPSLSNGKIASWAASGCDAEDSLFTDGALTSGPLGASATRCVFDAIAPIRNSLFGGDQSQPGIALTNCLIRGCQAPAEGSASPFLNCRLVNCTVVGNTFAGNGFVYDCSLVNCLLSGNRTVDGTPSDLLHRVKDDSMLTIRACVYGVNSQPDDVTSFADAGDSLALGSRRPGFNAGKRPGFPYYSLRRTSPARQKGVDAAAFAGTLDLAGNPRVHDDGAGSYTLDVGCYECWAPETGIFLILR